MYVGYVLDKDSPMYPGPARPASLGLGPQAYGPPPPPPAPPQYPDFTGYSHVEPVPAPPAAWSAPFPAPKDDWAATYGPGPAAPAASPAPLAFGPPPDFSPVPAPPGPGPGLLAQPLGGPGAPSSPEAQRRTPYEWMRRSVAAGGGGGSGQIVDPDEEDRAGDDTKGTQEEEEGAPMTEDDGGEKQLQGHHVPPMPASCQLQTSGKTRTKDKYRVVYTDHQRLELEKEFHYSRYITIRRKSELAANLGLTERQVKIWFQNRRAKERKVNKKKQQQQQQPPLPTHNVTPASAGPPLGGLCPSSANLLGTSSPLPVKEEYLP